MRYIDFRSDTVTQPTEEMRRAMYDAALGDDVYGDDPTVNRLESLSAHILGKQAAVFVPTGTMGNQASIMAHTHPGQEIIAGAYSHIVHSEAGGSARLSGVSCAMADNLDFNIYPQDIHRLVRGDNIHYPRTSLLCIENALGNGDIVPLQLMAENYEAAKSHGLLVHLDGARIFNAACALGVPAGDIARYTDSVTFCISKGLCAPAGSVICGEAQFISEVRRCRKLLGGGMRQAGVLAACGIVALEQMTDRLADDHENARYLGGLLAQIPGINVDIDRIKINMVFWSADDPGFDCRGLGGYMEQRGIKINGDDGGMFRLVTHHGVSKGDSDTFADHLRSYMSTN